MLIERDDKKKIWQEEEVGILKHVFVYSFKGM